MRNAKVFFIAALVLLFAFFGEAQNAKEKLIHVIVALCDNRYQGIVPVPERLGNGDSPGTNLYWGAAFGVKNFFKLSKKWKLISEKQKPTTTILERCTFQRDEVVLVADAYRGREIKIAIADFLDKAAGFNSKANLICFVGHNGLMDFNLDHYPKSKDSGLRDVMILACASKNYFYQPILQTKANPVLWTTGLMAPEAYVLQAAIDGWLAGKTGDEIRTLAAESYNKYQHCGLNAAKKLFATGW
ncbi:MAG TPA: hypothetical protein VH815_06720 [Acidobacteriota bacterium]